MYTGMLYIKHRKMSNKGVYVYFEIIKQVKYTSVNHRKILISTLSLRYNVDNYNTVLSVLPKL